MSSSDLLILGGGLAGLTAALHVAGAGRSVTVIEKHGYPRHKVCGEYLSSEVRPYFDDLGVPLRSWQPREVRRFRLHAPSGRWAEARLPLGGLGLRRYTLDDRLHRLARERGVRFVLGTTAREVSLAGDRLSVRTRDGREWTARAVVGSFGRRSELDRGLERPLPPRISDHVGVKFYLRTEFPGDLVALYGFEGGYAGAVRVEDGTVDVAYLTSGRVLREHGSLEAVEERVLHRNPALRDLLANASRTEARPLAISAFSFSPREQVQGHVLLVGDAAGMIPPLSGNGMAMAVHGAKLASESILAFLAGSLDRIGMERDFELRWRRQFAHRLFWGRRLHPLLAHPRVSELAVAALRGLPPLLPALVRQTHGVAFR